MKTFVDLTGLKIGYLTVLELDHKEKFSSGFKKYWKCQCKCGNIAVVEGTKLTSKKRPTKSCGCYNLEILHSMGEDLTGKSFNYLTVLSLSHIKNKRKYWNCKCICGNEKVFIGTNIKRGLTKSCGCKFKELLRSSSPTILSIEYAQKIAEQHDGKCLSNKYENIDTKMLWECKENHHWQATLGEIKRYWCPYCSGSILTISELNKIAQNNGGRCLSKEYNNDGKKLQWECENKHTWWASPYKIKNETWCPNCNLGRKQKELTFIIQELLPNSIIYSNYNKFDWLTTCKNGKQSFDIFIKDLKIAIEYDGQQHFYPVCFGGISEKEAETNFKRTQYLDKRKDKVTKEHKNDVILLIRFNYMEKISKDLVIEKFKSHNILL